MNTFALDTQTLLNIDEVDSAANRTAFSPGFLAAYNQAYFDICAEKIHPMAWQQVTLDADKQVLASTLTSGIKPDGLLSVKKFKDFSAEAGFGYALEYEAFWADDTHIVVPCADVSGSVWVHYEYYPIALTNTNPTTTTGNTSQPVLLKDAYQPVLSMFAAAVFFRGRKKFEREADWLNAYGMSIQSITGYKDKSQGKFINSMPVMPSL